MVSKRPTYYLRGSPIENDHTPHFRKKAAELFTSNLSSIVLHQECTTTRWRRTSAGWRPVWTASCKSTTLTSTSKMTTSTSCKSWQCTQLSPLMHLYTVCEILISHPCLNTAVDMVQLSRTRLPHFWEVTSLASFQKQGLLICRTSLRHANRWTFSTFFHGYFSGSAAQEAIKIISHQFVPFSNTFIYNAMSQTSATFQL